MSKPFSSLAAVPEDGDVEDGDVQLTTVSVIGEIPKDHPRNKEEKTQRQLEIKKKKRASYFGGEQAMKKAKANLW